RGETDRGQDFDTDRGTDSEHDGVCAGREDGAGGGGSGGRTVHRRSGAGAGIFKSSGVDGGEVCTEPIRGKKRRAVVSDGGSNAMAGGGEAGICGAARRAGEGEGVSDRAGRD